MDLLASRLLPPIPAAFVDGRERDLLAPLAFAAAGEEEAIAAEIARSGAPSPPDRAALAAALAVANRAYGHPAAEALAAKLKNPATRVVATGQQPGLFGGPLYALSKMAAATRWAEAIERAGAPAVAIFWVATEDHDWAESSRASFLAQGAVRTVDLGPDPAPLSPLGVRTLGEAMPSAIAALAELAAAFPGAAEELATLARHYRPDARFGEAFARSAVHFLGARTPLLLDAFLPELKAAERPHLRRLVERRAELESGFAAADAAIAARGLPLQVAPQRGASPLFLYRHGARRRIEWRGDDGYALRGEAETRPVAELLATLEENPSVVSPGVLARPAIQDAVLGTDLLLLGPGELSYLPQVAPSYRTLGLVGPRVALRPQVQVVDEREAARLDELAASGLGLGVLLADDASFERALAERAGGDLTGETRGEIAQALERLEARARALSPDLVRPLEKTREGIFRSLDTFAEKALAAAARSDEVLARRAAQLRALLRPSGKLQERELAAAHFALRFGPAFGAALLDQIELDPRRLHTVALPRPEASSR